MPRLEPDIPPSPYAIWRESQDVPIIHGLVVDDVTGDIPLAPWARKGVDGAFVDLIGGEESIDSTILEIAPKKNTLPERFMYEEEIVVLSGRGATTVWVSEKEKKQTFEWQKGSVFSAPMNSWRQHFNASPSEPVRLLCLSTAPLMFNLFRSTDYIFDCDHVFKDRFIGEDDFFTSAGEALPNRVWRSNFVPNIYDFKLDNYPARGGSGRGTSFDMAGNTLQSHIAQFPVGTYKLAHRHGPGAHILILNGSGYSLMWEEGGPKHQVDWQPGSLLAPPDMWFHQHFNTGSEPARYFAVHYGYWRVVFKDMGPPSGHTAAGHQIAYDDEDADVLETFLTELESKGNAPSQPIEEWRR